ncbi:hypothetical protein MHYP_G00238020 [Metynnis hypsauchen]
MNSAGHFAPGGGGPTRSALRHCPFKGAVLAGGRVNGDMGDRWKAWLSASAGKFERSCADRQLFRRLRTARTHTQLREDGERIASVSA